MAFLSVPQDVASRAWSYESELQQACNPFLNGKAFASVTFALYVEHAVREPQYLQRRRGEPARVRPRGRQAPRRWEPRVVGMRDVRDPVLPSRPFDRPH